jgi:hypothetical protein
MHAQPTAGSSAKRDARSLVKTKTPGIYRRRNADGTLGQYVVIYRAAGKQRREYADTLSEARRIRAERTADVARGEYHVRTTIALRAFLADWIERYHGKGGRNGFREGTREEYRRLLTSTRTATSASGCASSMSRRITWRSSSHGWPTTASRVSAWRTRRSTTRSCRCAPHWRRRGGRG